jgi:inhibitor of cysteine peptidase
MVQKEVKRKTGIYALVAVLSAVVLVSMVYSFGYYPALSPLTQLPTVSGMKTFSSVDEIKTYLTSNSINSPLQPLPNEYWARPGAVALTSGSTDQGTYGVTTDYSTTNIQVAGVDEADTVKTDGQYIYTLSSTQPTGGYYYYDSSSQTSNNIYIVSANPQNPSVVSKIVLDNQSTPMGLFLSSDSKKLVVFESKYQSYSPLGSSEIKIVPYYSSEFTAIYVYDISNKANPTLARNLTVTGNYFNSRMIGNYVYAVTSQSAYIYDDVVPVPALYNGDTVLAASPSSIYYADMNQSSSYSFTSFYGLDLSNDLQQPTNMTVLMSGASTMYVSPDNIYVAYPNWVNGSDVTAIYRVKIDGLQLTLEAQGNVPGYTINQYAIDEYSGNLRIATNLWQYTAQSDVLGGQQGAQINNVYVLDQNLAIIGRLEGLAVGENLHSVRFMGERGYLVTFKKTDPLFVIDLSQPSNPMVLGELVIPGYSDYLHPYDETHLIGVGKEAVDSGQYDFAYYQGVKLALFDVSNLNNPIQVANYVIGDRGTDSAVLSDPKAFLFDKTKALLVMPVSLALVSEENRQQQGSGAYGQTVWQGAYVFSVSANGNFTLKGTVTHLEASLLNSTGYLSDSNNYYTTQNEWITRSLYIDNTLYTISNSEVKLNSLTNLSEIATVHLS